MIAMVPANAIIATASCAPPATPWRRSSAPLMGLAAANPGRRYVRHVSVA